MGSNLRYVSQSDTKSSPNDFFSALENLIHELFIQGDNEILDSQDGLYSADRIHLSSENAYNEIFKRMPTSIQSLAAINRDRPPLVGMSELDLIDFLLHYKANRVLFVLGTIGIGKTTFLRHVFYRLPRFCQELQIYFPIMIDCLRVCNKDMNYGNLVYAAVSSAREYIRKQPLTDKEERLEALWERYDFASTGRTLPATSSSVLGFLKELREVVGPERHLVLIFDNLDQCLPAIVTEICDLGRAIFLDSSAFVILALRPETYRRQMELLHDSGAYYRFSITLPPPNLLTIILCRLRAALDQYGRAELRDRQTIRITLTEPNRQLEALINQVLTPHIQTAYLTGLFNNNVRRALAAFATFLSYRNLEYRLLFPVPPSDDLMDLKPSTASFPGGWFAHLVDGLMLGTRRYYHDDGRTPIVNLLVLDRPGHEPDYLVLYRALTLMGRISAFLPRDQVLNWLVALGHSRPLAEMALEYLLHRKLIYCPDEEKRISLAAHLRISDAGQYYFQEFVHYPQYLFNAVYDVPLNHDLAVKHDPGHLSVRLDSIRELICRVISAEESSIKIAQQELKNPWVWGCLRRHGLLTERLLSAAASIVDDAYHARSPTVFEAARSFREAIQPLRNRAKALSGIISVQIPGRQKNSPNSPDGVGQATVFRESDHKVLRARIPEMLNPAEDNVVRFETNIKDLNNTAREPVVLVWSAVTGKKERSQMVRLERNEENASYVGEFAVADVAEEVPFPTADFMLFSGSEAIAIDRIRGGH